MLLAAVAAVLAGARSFAAIGEWVADAPPQVLGPLGVRRDPLTGRFEPPDEATIRRVLERVDAGAFDRVVGSAAVRFGRPEVAQIRPIGVPRLAIGAPEHVAPDCRAGSAPGAANAWTGRRGGGHVSQW